MQNSFFSSHKAVSACANVSIHLKSVCNHLSPKFGTLMGKNNLETIAQNQNRFNLKIPRKEELSCHLFKCIHSKNSNLH